MSKTRKREFDNDDDNSYEIFRKKKNKLKYGKNCSSDMRRGKMSTNQLLKAYETGRLQEDE